MSNVRLMIDAARNNNAVDFEKHFVNETKDRIGSALESMRTNVYRNVLGLQMEDCEDKEMETDNDQEDDSEDENEED